MPEMKAVGGTEVSELIERAFSKRTETNLIIMLAPSSMHYAIVLKLDLHDDREKKKALKAVSGLQGIDSISMDMKDKKLTVIGSVDPVDIVSKLKKHWYPEILTVGPAKEPEKKKDDKKDDKKEDSKKDGDKKDDPNKQIAELINAYKAYNPYMTTQYYVHSMEENPNACVIC